MRSCKSIRQPATPRSISAAGYLSLERLPQDRADQYMDACVPSRLGSDSPFCFRR